MNFILACFWSLVLTYAANSLIMLQETSVTDIQVLDGRLEAFPFLGSLSKCISECYMDPVCVSIAYSNETTSCQLYKFDFANFTVNVIEQDKTNFFKVVCDQQNFTYIRSLNICMRVHHNEETFNDSRSTCANDDAHLLQVDSVDKMDYLKGILAHIHDDGYDYYLGGYGLPSSTDYFWYGMNGSPDSLINKDNGGCHWGVDGVDHCSSNSGCCLSLHSDGQTTRLASANCYDEFMFICVIDF